MGDGFLKASLRTHIASVQSAGSFATSGQYKSIPLPGLHIRSIGHIKLPLSNEDANTLFQASHQAPFAKTNETLAGVTIRNTLEIDASQITFTNPRWAEFVEETLHRVSRELGVSCSTKYVRADLYKMLVDKTGAMFKPHGDAEKCPGTFGTLVICLPSEHTGGSAVLRHGSEQQHISTALNSAFDTSYSAWYTDVVHEYLPVESGHRFVLIYSLVKDPRCSEQSAAALDRRLRDLTDLLLHWRSSRVFPSYLVFCLEHKYEQMPLAISQLKGNDAPRALHIAQACKKDGNFYFFVADMETISNRQRHMNNRAFMARALSDDGISMGVDRWIPIRDYHIVTRPTHEDRDHDKQDRGKYWRNSRAKLEDVFNNNAIIIVQKNNVSPLFLGRDYNEKAFGDLLDTLKRENQDKLNTPLLDSLIFQFCSYALYNSHNDAILGIIAKTAIEINEHGLFTEAVKRLEGCFPNDVWEDLGKVITLKSLPVSEEIFIDALTKSRKFDLVYRALSSFERGISKGIHKNEGGYDLAYRHGWIDTILLQSLSKTDSLPSEGVCRLVDVIVKRTGSPLRQFIVYQNVRCFCIRMLERGMFAFELALEIYIANGPYGQAGKFLDRLFKIVVDRAVSTFQLQAALDHLELKQQVKALSTPAIIITSLLKDLNGRQLATLMRAMAMSAPQVEPGILSRFVWDFLNRAVGIVERSSAAVQQDFQTLASLYIDAEMGTEPAKPHDWARPHEVQYPTFSSDCACVENVNCFLKDSTLEELILPCNQPHVKGLTHHALEFLAVEYEDGIPAVVRKTTAEWEQDHRNWIRRGKLAVNNLQDIPDAFLQGLLAEQYKPVDNLSEDSDNLSDDSDDDQ